ncbi:MAG: L-lactate permease, partial [Chloroflexi bacterium]|nr:L-lactate permease [Chloroflexota bacterium]
FFDLLVPFWLIAAFAGLGGMLEIWPALLVAGGSFAIVQLLVSNLHGPWLVNILAALVSLACLVLFLLRWRPRRIWGLPGDSEAQANADQPVYSRREVIRAWTPWIILSLLIFLWGLPGVKSWLDSFSVVLIPIPALHEMVLRVPPIVAAAHAESAVFTFNGLSTTGTAILLAALVSGLWMGYSLPELVRAYGAALRQIRFSALTIAAMMAIGFVTRYAGLDATMGLAFARTGVLYPFFGTLLGWLGVALTGSDTSSNVLFGSLQRVTAEQLGLNPYLMASANSAGGVMGKMIDAQSIVVASTATRWFGHEGDILRYVFFHSLALAVLVALLILLQAYVPPFTWMAAVP